MRRPVVPVPPVRRMRGWWWLVMPPTQGEEHETFHRPLIQIHTHSSTLRIMDRMSALLDGPRARGAFVVRCLLQPPWGLHVCDEAPLTVVAVVRGEAWITQGDAVVHARAGSVALVVGPEPYDIASALDVTPGVIIHPGQHCETVDGESLEMSMRLGVRSWGHALDAPTAILTGTYEHHSALGA